MAGKTITVDTYCPGCKKEHPTAIPIEDIELSIGRVQKDDDKEEREFSKRLDSIEKLLAERDKPKPEEKPKIEKVKEYPSFMPGEVCLSGNCGAGGVHPNKNYRNKPAKKCTNCDQFAPKGAKKCAWCKKEEFDDLEPEELEDMGIPLPKEDDHEHHHHEGE